MDSNNLQGRTILLVEDDSTVVAVVGEKLRMKGAHALYANTGLQAEDLLREHPVDLMILDVGLPAGEDGFELCRKFKADEEIKNIPIIFLTARDEPKQRVKGLRLGAVDYIIKPFDLDELIERIDIALRIKSYHPIPDTAPVHASTEASPTSEHETIPAILDWDPFLQLVEDRFNKLNRDKGLLSLGLVRVDMEHELVHPGHETLCEQIRKTLFELVRKLVPEGTLLSHLDPLGAAMLVPRKNKYGMELILDELKNLLAVQSFGPHGTETHITISAGVAEYPNKQIDNPREFLETAQFALSRAIRLGGNQTVLL